jgi:hypothetical protein
MKQKFKGELLTEKKCINSILRFYELASLSELRDGLSWYNEANKYCRELAARFGISLQQAAGIIAAFSPQTGWVENKRFALSFLYNPTRRIKSLVQTNKAKRILNLSAEPDIYNALSIANAGFKTKGFFLNMINPDIITDVTIDRHAIACCIQNPDNVYALSVKSGKLTRAQYDFFQHCFIQAAKQLDILPHQLQAITWVTYRRIRDLKKHDTTTEWKPFTNENPF